jgi:hypothetical protein
VQPDLQIPLAFSADGKKRPFAQPEGEWAGAAAAYTVPTQIQGPADGFLRESAKEMNGSVI